MKRPLRQFRGNPYLFLGRRPFVEAELRSYILREHRDGRDLDDIRRDPYLRCRARESLVWRVISEPETIAALAADVRDAIAGCRVEPRPAAQ